MHIMWWTSSHIRGFAALAGAWLRTEETRVPLHPSSYGFTQLENDFTLSFFTAILILLHRLRCREDDSSDVETGSFIPIHWWTAVACRPPSSCTSAVRSTRRLLVCYWTTRQRPQFLCQAHSESIRPFFTKSLSQGIHLISHHTSIKKSLTTK